MLRATLSCPNLDDPGLAARWTAHARACQASPFRSWAWVGCLARERYPDPLLAEIHDGSNLVGLALFNRRRRWHGTTLHLHETGDPALDAVFIEHNGIVARPEHQAEALRATLHAVRRLASRIILSGVDDPSLAVIRAAGGIIGPHQARAAPFARLDQDPGLSRNSRAQLRRSDRSYAAAGPVLLERAETPDQALEWLDRLVVLHAATWRARGIPSGFNQPAVQRFHRALIRRGVPDGTVDLLRIAAGRRTIGYLLNLVGGHRVAAYQSGFDYADAGPHEKPGLTAHHAAMAHAAAAGATEYDFLAGDSRYKRSLANDSRTLHWLTWQPCLSWPGLLALSRQALRPDASR